MKKLLFFLLLLFPFILKAQPIQTIPYSSTYAMRNDPFIALNAGDKAILAGVTRVNGLWKNILGTYHWVNSGAGTDDSLNTIWVINYAAGSGWIADSIVIYSSPLDSNTYMATKTDLATKFDKPTGTSTQVLGGNGSVLNTSLLITSFVLSYANGVLTGTITPSSGSPITDTATISVIPTQLPTNMTASTPTRTLGTTGWIPHTTKGSLCYYTVTCTATNPLLAGTSSSSFVLEYYNGSSWVPIENTGNSNGVGLAVAVALTNGQTGVLSTYVAANMEIRIQVTNTGSATGSIVRSLEWN